MDTPSDKVIDLYERHAAGWDADRQHRRPEGEHTWINRFANLAAPGARLLDMGCGSGVPIVPDLLAAGHAVTGVDASPALISLCRSRFPEQEWIVADMRTLDLGRRFGGLLAWHSLFHLTPADQEKMFAVFADHLEAGAPLMFTSGSQRDETTGQWRGEPLYHASLSKAEYRALLLQNAFNLVDHLESDPGCGDATVWLATRADV